VLGHEFVGEVVSVMESDESLRRKGAVRKVGRTSIP